MFATLRLLALAAVAARIAAPAPAAPSPCVFTVDIDSVVHPVTVDILTRSIAQAQERNCRLILLNLNTPGGFLEATRESIERIVSSPVPFVAYVTPSGGRAASAGFFLLQSADVAAMAPGTHTGAAHPVMIAGTPDEVMKKKIENDAAASLRTLTDRRGRNSSLAEQAVRESRSFTEGEALKERIIDLIAPNQNDLIAQLNHRPIRRFDGQTVTLDLDNPVFVAYQPTLSQRVRSQLADPNLALGITVLGALGLYIEFTSPGVVFPGVAGAILILLGLSSLSVLPLTWTGIALLLLAFALFALEAKIASHGVLGIGGAVALVLGAVLLIDSPLPELRIHLSTALALALPFAGITMFLVTIIVRARQSSVATGAEAVIGASAVTLTPLTPEGQVLFHGEIWQARASREIPAGSTVRITALTGLILTVEPLHPGA